jgi:hypothetical protein
MLNNQMVYIDILCGSMNAIFMRWPLQVSFTETSLGVTIFCLQGFHQHFPHEAVDIFEET